MRIKKSLYSIRNFIHYFKSANRDQDFDLFCCIYFWRKKTFLCTENYFMDLEVKISTGSDKQQKRKMKEMEKKTDLFRSEMFLPTAINTQITCSKNNSWVTAMFNFSLGLIKYFLFELNWENLNSIFQQTEIERKLGGADCERTTPKIREFKLF